MLTQPRPPPLRACHIAAMPAKPEKPADSTTRLVGLKNQGATCYMNSLIQTLRWTPGFRERLFGLGADQLGNLVFWTSA